MFKGNIHRIADRQPVRLADGWCWFLLREEYCWLVAGGWFVLREKYCWLVADKPSEHGASQQFLFIIPPFWVIELVKQMKESTVVTLTLVYSQVTNDTGSCPSMSELLSSWRKMRASQMENWNKVSQLEVGFQLPGPFRKRRQCYKVNILQQLQHSFVI
jgi:hypothetical protein